MNSNSYNIVSAIRGPLLLITLGTLFAMDYFEGISFARTWSILLIVFGILKLLERLAVRAPDHHPSAYTPPGDNVI
jgi:hypothetical protein